MIPFCDSYRMDIIIIDDPVGLSEEERKEKLDAMVGYYRKTLKEDGGKEPDGPDN